jgi:hypothetical protein
VPETIFKKIMLRGPPLQNKIAKTKFDYSFILIGE